jgi:predicted acetyltransferase
VLELIKRCPEYVLGYRDYCRKLYDNNISYFRPTNPDSIDDDWFLRTKDWYDKKAKGLIEGQPVSFHYWAIDNGKFIGEFQLRIGFGEKVLNDIGSIGYAVRVSEWKKGYGSEILRLGLEIAREKGMEKVLLNINENNTASICLCEKFGGVLEDRIRTKENETLRRYWIKLQ